MICPNCKSKMIKDYCVKCGYMNNGNFITKEIKENNKYLDIRLYNKNFDSMQHNQDVWLIVILGPYYFSYRHHLILGTILGIIDYIILKFITIISLSLSNIAYINILCGLYFSAFYLIVTRALYIFSSNIICLLLDKHYIKKIRKKCKNYKKKLIKHNDTSVVYILISILINILIYKILMKLL